MEFLKDQPSTAKWTGFASKISPVKYASLAIVISKQYNGTLYPHPLAHDVWATALALQHYL